MEAKPEKNVTKVVSGKAAKHKRSGMTKFTDVFVEEDMTTVKGYLFSDVIVPAIKDAVANVITDGVNMLLFGETRGGRRYSHGSSRTPYESIYNSRSSKASTRKRVSGYAYDNVVLETRGEAEEVLDNMYELVDTYGVASVMDLYDLAGLETRHTDGHYGWDADSINSATIVRRSRDEYEIKMPRPKQI